MVSCRTDWAASDVTTAPRASREIDSTRRPVRGPAMGPLATDRPCNRLDPQMQAELPLRRVWMLVREDDGGGG